MSARRTNNIDLYRYFDADGKLLYIGISLCAFRRAVEHSQSGWWNDVRRMERTPLGLTRKEAEQVERRAILAEKPLHNIARHLPKEKESRPRSHRLTPFDVASPLLPRRESNLRMDGRFSGVPVAIDLSRDIPHWADDEPRFSVATVAEILGTDRWVVERLIERRSLGADQAGPLRNLVRLSHLTQYLWECGAIIKFKEMVSA